MAMNPFAGQKVLVIGLGRAGLGMAKALRWTGAGVLVVDQKQADDPSMFEPMDALSILGIEVVTGWAGDVDWDTVDAIAVSPGVPRHHPVLVEAVARTVPVWGEIEIAYRIARAPMVCITGTNGKSTVTALTHHIFEASGRMAYLCGNVAGTGLRELTVNQAALEAPESAFLVTEVSSFQLEWIGAFRPRASTITRISGDHLDRYHTFEEYAETKLKMFQNAGAGDTVVRNLMRPETHVPLPETVRTLAYGEAEGDIRVDDARLTLPSGETVLERADLWHPSRHNLENAACAALLAHSQGIPLESCWSAVRSFRGIRHRMEPVGAKAGVRFVNNSMCTNPDALAASVRSVGGPVVLIAGGINKVEDWGAVSSVFPQLRAVLLYGQDAESLRRVFEEGVAQVRTTDSMRNAFQSAVELAKEGDTVILSPGCSSFDQFEDFIARGDAFRNLVKEWTGDET